MGFILAAMIDARALYVTSSRQTGRHLFGFDRSPFFGTGVSVPVLHSLITVLLFPFQNSGLLEEENFDVKEKCDKVRRQIEMLTSLKTKVD